MTAADRVTTADELAFYRRICDEPREDTPRLVYADWLEERGGSVPCGRCGGEGVIGRYTEAALPPLCPACSGVGSVSDGRAERAEFIRVQCELARWEGRSAHTASGRNDSRVELSDGKGNMIDGGRLDALRRRERELFAEVRSAIRETLPDGWDVTLPDPKSVVYREQTGGFGVVRRGFVHSVTLPLAAFLGGPCGWCWGTGIRHGSPPPWAEWGTDKCGYCSGTGRTPGAAAGLRWMPVERVTFGDKRPTPMLGHEADRGRGAWYDQGLLDAAFPGEGPHPYGVPAELFGLLTGHVDGARGGMAWYDTEADALSALSAAAVAYLAGLRGNL
jgi:uncharacterized protein (TIGR02996 family)